MTDSIARQIIESITEAAIKNVLAYHGTDEPFDQFEYRQGTRSTTLGTEWHVDANGFFFAETPEDASEFGRNVVEVQLSIKNPLLDGKQHNWRDSELIDDMAYILEPLLARESDGRYFLELGLKSHPVGRTPMDEPDRWAYLVDEFGYGTLDWNVLDNAESVKRMRKRGYDGTVVADQTSSGRSYFVVSPRQISVLRWLGESIATAPRRNEVAETGVHTEFATLDEVMAPETELVEVAAPSCPWSGTKTTMYGGLPGGGGFRPVTEYLVGAARIFEAAHCVIGSLVRMQGDPDNRGELAHIEEEMDIIGRKGILDYGRDIQPYSLDPNVSHSDTIYLQEAVDEIRAKAPKLRKKAIKWRDLIKRNRDAAQPEIWQAAVATYDFVIILAGALLLSVKDWPDNFESAYNMPNVRAAYKELEQAVEKLYDAGTTIRRESDNLRATYRIIEQIT
jgi:hypothetical protein